MVTTRRYTLIVLSMILFSAICVLGALPNPTPAPGNPQRQPARITIKGGQPIKVNGNDVTNGGTIVTGSTIEVPDQVSVVIEIGNETLELSPNTKIQLDYDENGNVRAKLYNGCAAARKNYPGDWEAKQGPSRLLKSLFLVKDFGRAVEV